MKGGYILRLAVVLCLLLAPAVVSQGTLGALVRADGGGLVHPPGNVVQPPGGTDSYRDRGCYPHPQNREFYQRDSYHHGYDKRYKHDRHKKYHHYDRGGPHHHYHHHGDRYSR